MSNIVDTLVIITELYRDRGKFDSERGSETPVGQGAVSFIVDTNWVKSQNNIVLGKLDR